MFKKAKLIWLKNSKFDVNEFADFKQDFVANTNDKYILRICSVSEFVVYVNDVLVGFGQYANFKDHKFCNEYNLMPFLKDGLNSLYVVALAKNYDCSSHIADGKGIIFEIVDGNENVICYSGEEVLSRLDPNYISGPQHDISGQLGMSYSYSFVSSDNPYDKSAIIDKNPIYTARPIKFIDASTRVEFFKIKDNLYGYSKEAVGYLFFDIDSDIEQDIEIGYGEHITDGNVRTKIHTRDFSEHFKLKKGNNTFVGYFLRLGLRYLNIPSLQGKVNHIGVYQAFYPHKYVKQDFGELNEIVGKCLYTIDCCMHEHYEDCPWREQAQYTLDSRIDMLINYMAFDEFDFPKASLKQMSHLLTNKGVLPITSPCSKDLSITVYSLVYPLMVKEYFEYTGDKTLLAEVFDNLSKVMNVYIGKLINGLLPHVDEWNFYEWAEGLDNALEIENPKLIKDQFDLPLNAFMIVALESFAYICKALSLPFDDYLYLTKTIKENAHNLFYKDGIFYTYCKQGNLEHKCEYSNYLAIYSGIANEQEAEEIIHILTSKNDLIHLTLCNYIFKYDILLRNPKYHDYIIRDIKDIWGKMDEAGATTYWETSLGEKDFDGAGSLCHGWSAVPAYVMYKMKKMGQ